MARKLYANIMLMATPTDPKHIVNLETVQRMIDRKLKSAVRVVMASNFDAEYNSTAKTLTQDTPAAFEIDGVTLALNDRVLVAGQTDGTQNGIYIVSTLGTSSVAGVLTRADDFNDSADIIPGCIIPVLEGDENADTNWQLINDSAVTLDSTVLSFAKFNGNVSMNIYSGTFAGNGTDKEFAITHGLDTENVVVQVYDKATKEKCEFNVKVTSSNVITIKSDVVLENTDEFIVTVVGVG